MRHFRGRPARNELATVSIDGGKSMQHVEKFVHKEYNLIRLPSELHVHWFHEDSGSPESSRSAG